MLKAHVYVSGRKDMSSPYDGLVWQFNIGFGGGAAGLPHIFSMFQFAAALGNGAQPQRSSERYCHK